MPGSKLAVKIAYLLNSVSRQGGGLFEICRRLGQTVAEQSEVHVLGVQDEFTDADIHAWSPLKPITFKSTGLRSFAFAGRYAAHLAALAPDIAHIHALWIYPSLAGFKWHRRTKSPLMYTAHGMLDPWAVRNSGWKKKLARLLYEDAAHRSAACFHVNSENEYRSSRAYGLRNPMCIIPNGIDLPDMGVKRAAPWGDYALAGRKVLLYLGRLHPKKNLASLLQAWATVQRDHNSSRNWVLAIVGWDQNNHEAELRRLTSGLSIVSSVLFPGALFGDEKAAAYQNAAAFVLPSLSEGLPMVVLEAWAFAKPVLMTNECNLPEGFKVGAALRIGTSSHDIAAGLRQLLDMDESDRSAMGTRGRTLVRENFSWREIGAEMRRVCEWVVNGGSVPDSVRLD